MKMFSRFGGFGDEAMAARMKRGERIAALLAQPRLSPLKLLTQVALLSALNEGILDDVDLATISHLKTKLPSAFAADPILSELDLTSSRLDEGMKSSILEVVRTTLRQT
jgi:F-type H+-transporting ATPase subunit alpha